MDRIGDRGQQRLRHPMCALSRIKSLSLVLDFRSRVHPRPNTKFTYFMLCNVTSRKPYQTVDMEMKFIKRLSGRVSEMFGKGVCPTPDPEFSP